MSTPPTEFLPSDGRQVIISDHRRLINTAQLAAHLSLSEYCQQLPKFGALLMNMSGEVKYRLDVEEKTYQAIGADDNEVFLGWYEEHEQLCTILRHVDAAILLCKANSMFESKNNPDESKTHRASCLSGYDMQRSPTSKVAFIDNLIERDYGTPARFWGVLEFLAEIQNTTHERIGVLRETYMEFTNNTVDVTRYDAFVHMHIFRLRDFYQALLKTDLFVTEEADFEIPTYQDFHHPLTAHGAPATKPHIGLFGGSSCFMQTFHDGANVSVLAHTTLLIQISPTIVTNFDFRIKWPQIPLVRSTFQYMFIRTETKYMRGVTLREKFILMNNLAPFVTQFRAYVDLPGVGVCRMTFVLLQIPRLKGI